MAAPSFSARADDPICAATMTGCFCDLNVRVLLGSPRPETETNDEVPPPSAALQRLGSRVIWAATAKRDSFAITVKRRHVRGIVPVDLERGALVN